MESMGEHGSTQHHLVVVVDTRLSATSRSGLSFCYPLHSDAAGRVMVAPRRGTAQGTTRATTTKSASATTTTTTATTDAAARTRGEPRVAVVTSDDEQCLLGAANGGLGSLRCICSTPTLHICHPTAPFAEPAVSSHGCDGGGDLPISARPALAAIVTRRVAPYKCKDPTTVWKLPPCALQPKKQLVILNQLHAATPIGSGHRANRRAWHQQRSGQRLQVTASLLSLASLVATLRRLPHEVCLSKAFFAADCILARLASSANSPVTDHPSAGPPHSSNALSVLSISGRGTI
jgi:hypothetical protein